MAKPAARLTDMTAHGGTLVGPGVPNVLIGGLPAVGLGDQHVCPMATPGTPPIPHVGGPILVGSTGVLIGKKPAARMGDLAFCVGPASQILSGCATVLIGEAGSGSKAGEAGKAIAAKRAKVQGPNKLKPLPVRTQEVSPTENHAIHCRIKDKAGRPLVGLRYELTDQENQTLRGSASSEGLIFHPGYPQKGRFKGKIASIGNAKWNRATLKVDEEGVLTANVDAKDGEEVFLFLNLVLSGGVRLYRSESELSVQQKKVEFRFALTPETLQGFPPNQTPSIEGLEAILLYRNALALSPILTFKGFAEPASKIRPPLTLRLLAEKLVELEKKLGFETVTVLVESLDYGKLCHLGRLGGADNDPSLLPSRFLLLEGVSDAALKAKGRLDSLPYSTLLPDAAIFSVENLGRFLAFAGYRPKGSKAEGLLVGETFAALRRYLEEAPEPLDERKLKDRREHPVTEGQALSSIAALYGIRSFRLLWELNREALGEDWDRPKADSMLKLPSLADNPLRNWLSENGWEEYCPTNPGKGYQFPGKYLSLSLTAPDDMPIGTLDPSAKGEVYCANKDADLIHAFSLQSGDIDLMVPDGPFEIHVAGFDLFWNDHQTCSRAAYLAKHSSSSPADEAEQEDDGKRS